MKTGEFTIATRSCDARTSLAVLDMRTLERYRVVSASPRVLPGSGEIVSVLELHAAGASHADRGSLERIWEQLSPLEFDLRELLVRVPVTQELLPVVLMRTAVSRDLSRQRTVVLYAG